MKKILSCILAISLLFSLTTSLAEYKSLITELEKLVEAGTLTQSDIAPILKKLAPDEEQRTEPSDTTEYAELEYKKYMRKPDDFVGNKYVIRGEIFTELSWGDTFPKKYILWLWNEDLKSYIGNSVQVEITEKLDFNLLSGDVIEVLCIAKGAEDTSPIFTQAEGTNIKILEEAK